MTPIVKLEKRRRALRTVKRGDDEFETEYEDLGWFLQVEGIAIWVGEQKPEGWEVGDMMRLTIEKV